MLKNPTRLRIPEFHIRDSAAHLEELASDEPDFSGAQDPNGQFGEAPVVGATRALEPLAVQLVGSQFQETPLRHYHLTRISQDGFSAYKRF